MAATLITIDEAKELLRKQREICAEIYYTWVNNMGVQDMIEALSKAKSPVLPQEVDVNFSFVCDTKPLLELSEGDTKSQSKIIRNTKPPPHPPAPISNGIGQMPPSKMDIFKRKTPYDRMIELVDLWNSYQYKPRPFRTVYIDDLKECRREMHEIRKRNTDMELFHLAHYPEL